MINQKPSLVNLTLSEIESRESILDQPWVEKTVDLAPPSVNHTFPLKSEPHIAQVLLVSNELEENTPITEVHESNSLIPIAQEGHLSRSYDTPSE